MAVDEHTPLTMAAYGCVWPRASDTPSPKRLTYGCAHTWDPALPDNPANSHSQWLCMAVYMYPMGHVRRHPCMTPL
eukprot:30381-Pyramimonas_sp.AAC.1